MNKEGGGGNERKFYPTRNDWLHPRTTCDNDHTSVYRIDIADSSELKVVEYLIYLFNQGLSHIVDIWTLKITSTETSTKYEKFLATKK